MTCRVLRAAQMTDLFDSRSTIKQDDFQGLFKTCFPAYS